MCYKEALVASVCVWLPCSRTNLYLQFVQNNKESSLRSDVEDRVDCQDSVCSPRWSRVSDSFHPGLFLCEESHPGVHKLLFITCITSTYHRLDTLHSLTLLLALGKKKNEGYKLLCGRVTIVRGAEQLTHKKLLNILACSWILIHANKAASVWCSIMGCSCNRLAVMMSISIMSVFASCCWDVMWWITDGLTIENWGNRDRTWPCWDT